MQVHLALAAQLALMLALASSASRAPPDGHRVALGAEMSTFGAEAGSFTDPGSRRLFRQHFDSLSPGNELKWEYVEPEPGAFDFSTPTGCSTSPSATAPSFAGTRSSGTGRCRAGCVPGPRTGAFRCQ